MATTPVVDEAASAYRSAQALHDLRLDYDAFAEFDDTQAIYNPRNMQPLLSDRDIDIRLAVLAAFQCYAQSLVEITRGTSSPELEEASKSAGSSLKSVGNSLAPSIQSTLGIAGAAASTTETTITTTSGSTSSTTTSTSSTPAPLITTPMQNGISTAANALGQFLVSRKIKKELPQQIKEMDPYLQTLCDLLAKDIATLEDQQKRDYNSIINRQTLFIREFSASKTAPLNPQQRREEIMKLPDIVRRQRASEEQLAELRASILRLSLTHHELAADAQGDNPESLKSKLGDLEAAGSNLGHFYSSQPTK